MKEVREGTNIILSPESGQKSNLGEHVNHAKRFGFYPEG